MKIQKICVIGLGYIGLPTASTFASRDVDVVGMDANAAIVQTLQKGELHIHEPGLRQLMEEAIKTAHIRFSTQVEPADAFIIAVPTPFYDDKRADLRAVKAAAQSIVPHLQRGNLVVLESTSPPRTTVDVVAPILAQSGLKAGADFHLAYSPERVLPGRILEELIENARVIGGVDRASAEAGRDLYGIFVKGEIILTDATTAEMVKLMENTSRDVNIAIANEFCRLAHRFDVDAWEAISIANLHPRVNILRPGIGVGGHCISVDPWFFVEAAPDISTLICSARQVNDAQPHFVVDLIEKTTGALQGKKIGYLGLAFKPNVDDLRESPAVELVHLLQKRGAVVQCYEPYKPSAGLPGIHQVNDLADALKDADLVVLAVAHDELLALKPEDVLPLTSARMVFDGVNGWQALAWQAAGFSYAGLGKRQAEAG